MSADTAALTGLDFSGIKGAALGAAPCGGIAGKGIGGDGVLPALACVVD